MNDDCRTATWPLRAPGARSALTLTPAQGGAAKLEVANALVTLEDAIGKALVEMLDQVLDVGAVLDDGRHLKSIQARACLELNGNVERLFAGGVQLGRLNDPRWWTVAQIKALQLNGRQYSVAECRHEDIAPHLELACEHFTGGEATTPRMRVADPEKAADIELTPANLDGAVIGDLKRWRTLYVKYRGLWLTAARAPQHDRTVGKEASRESAAVPGWAGGRGHRPCLRRLGSAVGVDLS